ncbi:hypothetical protein MTO96_030481 [Rhipicephalus appendiculatus]
MKRDVLMMHERSVFRTPPDFTVLAEKYFDFSQHVTYNTLGKAKLDFKDADSQRALSKTLLKHFFELDVRLPQGRLVPAVPQRLNYLLWVQDLVEKVLERKDNVVALDVGTGASCVLALLGHKQCGWDFVGTETDPAAATSATENVTRNSLEEHVKVLEVGSLVEAVEKTESHKFDVPRSKGAPLRLPTWGGVESEKVWANSGETGFFKDVLLRDSLILRDKIGLYTCMLGKNSSVKEVLSALQNKVKSCRVAEFHQGKTTRYAVAWTFLNVNLQKLPYSKVRQQKQQTKIELVLPHSQVPVTLRVHYVWRELISALNSIEVPYEIINEGPEHVPPEEAKKAAEAKKPEDGPPCDQQAQETPKQEDAISEASDKKETPDAQSTEEPQKVDKQEPTESLSEPIEEKDPALELPEQSAALSQTSTNGPSSEAKPSESAVAPAEAQEAASESPAVSSEARDPSSAATSSNHVPAQSDPEPLPEQLPSWLSPEEAMEGDVGIDSDGCEGGSVKRKQEDESAADEPPSKVQRQDPDDKSLEESADDMAADEGVGGANPELDSTPLILSTDIRVRRIYADIVIHMTIRSGQSDVAHQLLQYIKNCLWGV